MVAGGGASVVYSDTVCALGSADELANYGEYSGAPSEEQTFEYAKAILGLMTKEPHPDGKVLIIGGGIANFTNVAATFKGLIRALKTYDATTPAARWRSGREGRPLAKALETTAHHHCHLPNPSHRP